MTGMNEVSNGALTRVTSHPLSSAIYSDDNPDDEIVTYLFGWVRNMRFAFVG